MFEQTLVPGPVVSEDSRDRSGELVVVSYLRNTVIRTIMTKMKSKGM